MIKEVSNQLIKKAINHPHFLKAILACQDIPQLGKLFHYGIKYMYHNDSSKIKATSSASFMQISSKTIAVKSIFIHSKFYSAKSLSSPLGQKYGTIHGGPLTHLESHFSTDIFLLLCCLK